MSTTTEAIDIIDGLVKAKIPKPVATKLVDFVDKQRDKSVDRLWIAMAILSAIMLGGFAWLRSDMRLMEDRIDKRFDKIDKRFDKIETEQKEQRKLLLQVLQKVSVAK